MREPSFAMYFVNRRKLIFIYREKRILFVAFSHKIVTFAGRRDKHQDP
jgi:hypothetical protein